MVMAFHHFVSGESGEVDIEKERQEMEIKRNLMMANKKLMSLEMPKYQLASDFYTQVNRFPHLFQI